jgi:cytochrome c peroxidase
MRGRFRSLLKRRGRAAILPGAFVALVGVVEPAATSDAPDMRVWRHAFARPASIPAPADNPITPEKVTLGRALFEDTRLSGDGALSCASCHQPLLSFTDGIDRRPGHDGEPLSRHTPSLWNLAWGLTFFWDGRAPSLEAQASGPIENVREMGGDLAKAADQLAADPDMAKSFAAAFPDDPRVSAANIRAALASFERTLVSPETRFDRWVVGDNDAIDADERAGFRLFVGKAGCANCHKGWRFTDEAFHDIGLRSSDRGRGETLSLAAADHAFKTPSLRERAWTGPYMHDGSLQTLDAVVDHYADAVVRRPTVSADLPARLELSADERAQLFAFLNTLSSDDPPRPQSMPASVQGVGGPSAEAISTTLVSERDRRFAPTAVSIGIGQALTVVNEDTRTHNVRIDDPRLTFSSDAQEPGGKVVLAFSQEGTFTAICGIHPDMRLEVTVTTSGRR